MRGKIIFLCLGLFIGALGVFAVLHLRDEPKGGTATKTLSPAPAKPVEPPPPIKQIELPNALRPPQSVAIAKGAKSAGREPTRYKWVSEKTAHGWVSRKELVTKDTGKNLSPGSGANPSGEDPQLTGLRFLRKGRNTALNFERSHLNQLRRDLMRTEPPLDEAGRSFLMEQLEETERQIQTLSDEIHRLDAEIEKRERLH
jgi:hypothetical protein